MKAVGHIVDILNIKDVVYNQSGYDQWNKFHNRDFVIYYKDYKSLDLSDRQGEWVFQDDYLYERECNRFFKELKTKLLEVDDNE